MDRRAIKKPLKEFVDRIVKTAGPDKIILYGSFARGEANTWSDIDLAVIGSRKLNRLDKMVDSIETNYCFDVRTFKKKQFKNISPLDIYSEIKREGVVLYSKTI